MDANDTAPDDVVYALLGLKDSDSSKRFASKDYRYYAYLWIDTHPEKALEK